MSDGLCFIVQFPVTLALASGLHLHYCTSRPHQPEPKINPVHIKQIVPGMSKSMWSDYSPPFSICPIQVEPQHALVNEFEYNVLLVLPWRCLVYGCMSVAMELFPPITGKSLLNSSSE